LVVLVVSGILSLSMVISSSSRSWLLVDASGEGGGEGMLFWGWSGSWRQAGASP
jgi:hypothetical protein